MINVYIIIFLSMSGIREEVFTFFRILNNKLNKNCNYNIKKTNLDINWI